MKPIKYTVSFIFPNIFRTEKYRNLLSNTYQGEVMLNDNGTWTGWFMNLSVPGEGDFKTGIGSKSAATRWVNARLREVGVK
jgi:hypothetical protein